MRLYFLGFACASCSSGLCMDYVGVGKRGGKYGTYGERWRLWVKKFHRKKLVQIPASLLSWSSSSFRALFSNEKAYWEKSRVWNTTFLWQMVAVCGREEYKCSCLVTFHEHQVIQSSSSLELTGWKPIVLLLHSIQETGEYQRDLSLTHAPPVCWNIHSIEYETTLCLKQCPPSLQSETAGHTPLQAYGSISTPLPPAQWKIYRHRQGQDRHSQPHWVICPLRRSKACFPGFQRITRANTLVPSISPTR